MRIAMLIGTYYPIMGGAEVFAQKVAEHLVENGHEVDVITLRAESKLAKYEKVNGVNVYRVGFFRVANLKSLSAIFPLAQKLLILDRQRNYDIVHSHSPFYEGLAGTIIKKLRGKVHLITAQGGGDIAEYEEYTGKFLGILRPLISWSLNNADMVHAVSTYLRSRAEELGAKATVLVPNGVDMSVFKPMNKDALRERLGYAKDDRIIVSSSRLSPKNGMDHLIKAMPTLMDSQPNVRLVIIGEGTQRKELEELITKLNLNHRVHLLGYIPHAQNPEYLGIGDVFARPSIVEGFGISFIEAMACKVPVVGTNVGGITDIIEDGKNGFMVKVGDIGDLTEKLRILLTDQELHRKFVEEGYRTVQEKFEWSPVFREMDSLYTELAGK